MHLKKSHTLASALMISSIFTPTSLATQQSVLAYHGVHVDASAAKLLHQRPDVAAKLATQGTPKAVQEDLRGFIMVYDANPPTTSIVEIDGQFKAVSKLRELGIDVPTPQDAKKLSDQAVVVEAFRTVVKPSGHVISPMDYLVAHEASLPNTPPLEVVQHHEGVKALAALGKDHPLPAETKASKYFSKQKWLDQMPNLLQSAIYLQQNSAGNLAAAIDEPSLPQMRATKFIADSGVLGANDQQINTIAFLVGVDRSLNPDEVREALRLAGLRVNFIPNRDQIREGLRQERYGGWARTIEHIDEGLRQKKVGIADPDPYSITEGLRLATIGLADSREKDLIAALTLQNPGGAPIIRDPDKLQVKAMKYLIKRADFGLGKPNADEVNAVVSLKDPAGFIKIPRPELKHILGLLRIDQIGGRPPTKALVMATAHLVNPDGLNENPRNFKRVDYVVHLQDVLKIDEPELAEIDAAAYLMDPGLGLGHIRIPLPTPEEIKATVYCRKSVVDGGLGDLNPLVDDIRAVAHLQKPVDDGGLNLMEPKLPHITAAKYLLLNLRLNPFTLEDFAAVMDLQMGHVGLKAIPYPLPEQVKATKCLLGHAKPDYVDQDLDATIYLQTNPGNALNAAALANPDWNQIKGTVYLQGAGGLNIRQPSLAQINGVVYAQTVLGLIDGAYLTPTLLQLTAIVHLQSAHVNIQKPSAAHIRATILLQTPGPGWLGMAGAILDANPSAQRIDATAELQDWQRPAAHVCQLALKIDPLMALKIDPSPAC